MQIWTPRWSSQTKTPCPKLKFKKMIKKINISYHAKYRLADGLAARGVALRCVGYVA